MTVIRGRTLRVAIRDGNPAWQPLLLVAEGGAIVIFCGILCQIAQLYVSIRDRKQHLDTTGDPWNGRTLEWATT